MPITFRHDAAGIPVGKDKSSQKYGYELVGQQRKYDAEARARSEAAQFESQQQANTQAFQWQRDRAQDVNRAGMFNAELQNRNKMAEDERKFQRDEAEARRKQEMMDRAQRQEHGFILQSIENGEYDQATSRALQQNILNESRAMTAPGLDATQRAAALQQVMDERAKLTALRREPPPKPAPQPVMYTDDQGRQWIQSGKDKWEQIKPQAEPQQGPIDSSVGFQDPKNRDRYLGLAEKDLMDPEDPTKKPSREQVWARARELWNTDEYQRTQRSAPQNGGPTGQPSPASPSGVQGGQPASPPGGMAIPPAQSQQPPVSAPAGGVVLPPYLPQEPSAAAPAPSPSPSGGVSQPPSGYLPGYEPKPKPVEMPNGRASGGAAGDVVRGFLQGQGLYPPTWGDIGPNTGATPPRSGRDMDPGFLVGEPALAGQVPQPGAMANEPVVVGGGKGATNTPNVLSEAEQAMAFLIANGIDLRQIGRKPRKPVGGVIPIVNDADRFQPGAYGTWNQSVRGPKY